MDKSNKDMKTNTNGDSVQDTTGEDNNDPDPIVIGDNDDKHSDASSDDVFDGLNKVFMHQQMANMTAMAKFLTYEDKNLCSALIDIKLAIDTNSRCLLKLHDLLERSLSK